MLWAINERLWYTAGFVGPCVEEAVPSRILSVLETTSTKAQPQYLPAGTAMCTSPVMHRVKQMKESSCRL